MFALEAGPLTIDRSEAGTLVMLLATSDPRREHLVGLTGGIEGVDSWGTLHVTWSTGERFGLNASDTYIRV